MEIAKVSVSGVRATTVWAHDIPAGITGAYITLEYADPLWYGLIRNVTFRGAEDRTVLNVGDKVYLPPEAAAVPGIGVYLGLCGIREDGSVEIPTLWADLGTVKSAAPTTAELEEEAPNEAPTPSMWAQVLAMIGSLDKLATEEKGSLVAAINWMVEKGIGTPEIGENGNWFIGGEDTGVPAQGEQGPQGVSGVYVGSGEMPDGYNVQIDPEGDADDLPGGTVTDEQIEAVVANYLEENPPAQGEPGQDGQDGYTPVKGEDYFTPEEVQEIAEQAAELVEVPESGSGIAVTGAEIGQIIRIAEVDEEGKPTAWEPCNPLSRFKKVVDLTLTEETNVIDIAYDHSDCLELLFEFNFVAPTNNPLTSAGTVRVGGWYPYTWDSMPGALNGAVPVSGSQISRLHAILTKIDGVEYAEKTWVNWEMTSVVKTTVAKSWVSAGSHRRFVICAWNKDVYFGVGTTVCIYVR